jgi:hypothetical protein
MQVLFLSTECFLESIVTMNFSYCFSIILHAHRYRPALAALTARVAQDYDDLDGDSNGEVRS